MSTARAALQRALLPLAFIALTATAAHLAFSPLGFNPTDDGFTLAYSRRLLDGQVPHRDFIIIRPALSPLLHAPAVALGGDHVFLLSRWVVWMEMAAIAWLGVVVLGRLLEPPLAAWERVALALASFVALAHDFPVMAWHTLDGLLLCSLGLALCVGAPPSRARLVGYLLLGAATLCKQNFALVGPLCLLALGHARDWRAWLMLPLPALLYGAWLGLLGASADMALQLATHTSLAEAGLHAYRNDWVATGATLGLAAGALIHLHRPWPALARGPWRRLGGLALVGLPLAWLAANFATLGGHAPGAFFLVGALLGVALTGALAGPPRPHADAPRQRIAGLALILAWSASISVGYNSPALAAGWLLAGLALWGRAALLEDGARRASVRRAYAVTLCLGALLLTGAWVRLRLNSIYRDRPSAELTYRLDGVLAGAAGLRTNPRTHAFLSDLARAQALALTLGDTYSIVPDNAAHWVASAQPNPLPIDWPQGTELSKRALGERVSLAIEDARPGNVVLVQKFEANSLANGYEPLQSRYYAALYTRLHLERVGETEFFELYR